MADEQAAAAAAAAAKALNGETSSSSSGSSSAAEQQQQERARAGRQDRVARLALAAGVPQGLLRALQRLQATAVCPGEPGAGLQLSPQELEQLRERTNTACASKARMPPCSDWDASCWDLCLLRPLLH